MKDEELLAEWVRLNNLARSLNDAHKVGRSNMNDGVTEQIKQQAIEAEQNSAGLTIYKYRLESDDGWRFFAARGIYAARRKYPGKSVATASHADILGIALRALVSAGHV